MITAVRPVAPIRAIRGVAVRQVVEHAEPVVGGLHRIAAFLRDAALVLLVVLLIPIGILVVGAPITLAVRALIEIAQRF